VKEKRPPQLYISLRLLAAYEDSKLHVIRRATHLAGGPGRHNFTVPPSAYRFRTFWWSERMGETAVSLAVLSGRELRGWNVN